MKRVLGKRVLIEQVMIKRKTAIIRLPGAGTKAQDPYDITYRVIAVGSEVPPSEVEVGDIPVFGKHTEFHGVKLVLDEDEKKIAHVVVYYDDIIGVDEPPMEPVLKTTSKTVIN